MLKILEKAKTRVRKLVGLGTWILIILLLTSTFKNFSRVRSVNEAVQKEKEKIEKMRQENQELEAKIAQTQGSFYIEKQIRDKLGMAKAGESIVVLPDKEILRKLAPKVPVEENTLPDPNWKKWIKLFI